MFLSYLVYSYESQQVSFFYKNHDVLRGNFLLFTLGSSEAQNVCEWQRCWRVEVGGVVFFCTCHPAIISALSASCNSNSADDGGWRAEDEGFKMEHGIDTRSMKHAICKMQHGIWNMEQDRISLLVVYCLKMIFKVGTYNRESET